MMFMFVLLIVLILINQLLCKDVNYNKPVNLILSVVVYCVSAYLRTFKKFLLMNNFHVHVCVVYLYRLLMFLAFDDTMLVKFRNCFVSFKPLTAAFQ